MRGCGRSGTPGRGSRTTSSGSATATRNARSRPPRSDSDPARLAADPSAAVDLQVNDPDVDSPRAALIPESEYRDSGRLGCDPAWVNCMRWIRAAERFSSESALVVPASPSVTVHCLSLLSLSESVLVTDPPRVLSDGPDEFTASVMPYLARGARALVALDSGRAGPGPQSWPRSPLRSGVSPGPAPGRSGMAVRFRWQAPHLWTGCGQRGLEGSIAADAAGPKERHQGFGEPAQGSDSRGMHPPCKHSSSRGGQAKGGRRCRGPRSRTDVAD